MGSTRRVTYRGVVYRRSPARRYYQPAGYYLQRGWTSLHRQIWIDSFGAIPAGMHVHHRNGDLDDNRPENLELLSASEHAQRHYRDRREELAARLKDWRESVRGRAQLRRNGRALHESAPERTFACAHCGGAARTRHPTKRFCSPECSRAGAGWRTKACAVCGCEIRYRANRQRETQTCSYRCGWALRRSRAAASVQPDG